MQGRNSIRDFIMIKEYNENLKITLPNQVNNIPFYFTRKSCVCQIVDNCLMLPFRAFFLFSNTNACYVLFLSLKYLMPISVFGNAYLSQKSITFQYQVFAIKFFFNKNFHIYVSVDQTCVDD